MLIISFIILAQAYRQLKQNKKWNRVQHILLVLNEGGKKKHCLESNDVLCIEEVVFSPKKI